MVVMHLQLWAFISVESKTRAVVFGQRLVLVTGLLCAILFSVVTEDKRTNHMHATVEGKEDNSVCPWSLLTICHFMMLVTGCVLVIGWTWSLDDVGN